MNTKTIFRLSAVAALISSMTSCSNSINEEPIIDPNVIRIDAVHPSSINTRVTATGFENNDQIGVFVAAEGSILQAFGNSVNNGLFTYDGSQWNPMRTYYWNEGKHDIYAYYPYRELVDNVEDMSFTVASDQSAPEGYSSSDFLWAKAESQQAGTSAVKLIFSHIMSRAIVELVKGEKYEGEIPDNAEVTIHNVVPTASIDISTGSAGKDNYAAAESIKMQRIANGKYAAIIVPQRIDTRRPLVEVNIDNVSYLMEGSISFKQGFQHTITITLTANPQQAEIEIGGGINNWD